MNHFELMLVTRLGKTVPRGMEQMPRALMLALILAALAGCGARPGPELLSPVPPLAQPTRHVLLQVATNREPDAKSPGNFSNARSPRLSFARYVISVPPNHRPSAIELSAIRPVDPASSFATLEFTPLSDVAPGSSASAGDNATAQGEGGGRVFVFVHGYNTNYAESVLRMAQLVADNPSEGRAILFAWPSDGSLPGYVADKDSATYSRDHLAQLLTMLADDPRNREITLAAHSMGCWLAMESLRQLRLTGRGAVLERLNSVLLAAPDIDLDVFRAQAKGIGQLVPPITVLASPDDRALQFSNRLGGDRERLGGLDVRDPRIQDLAKDCGIQLIDISSMTATDSLNHDKFIGAVTSLKTALSPKKSENPFRRAGAFVLNAMATVLETPGRIGRAAAEVTR
jgi:esterase/lipase superfamily enzyme